MAGITLRGRHKRYKQIHSSEFQKPYEIVLQRTTLPIQWWIDTEDTFKLVVSVLLDYMPLEQAKHKARQYLYIPF
jgi:hypothetical protein